MNIKQMFKKLGDTYLVRDSLSVKEQVGYSSGLFGNAMGQDCVHTYGEIFDTDYLGISQARMLIKANVSNILSFLVPPMVGSLYDSPSRGKSSYLKRALRYAPIPFALASLLLFVVPSNSALFNFVWSFVFGMIFSIADTFFDIAMSTLGIKMCNDPKDRVKFYTFTNFANTLGSMLPGWLLPIVVDSTDDGEKQKILYFVVALAFCIMGLASMIATHLTVSDRHLNSVNLLAEKKRENLEPSKKVQWNRETLSAIFHNRPFMVIQLSLFTDAIRQVTYKNLPYFYKVVLDDFKLKSIFDAVSGALSYVGIFAFPAVCEKLPAHLVMAGGYAYTGIFYLLMSLFDVKFSITRVRKFRYLFGLLIGFAGMPNGAQGTARKVLIADSTDYMEWYGYKHFGDATKCDGLLYAASNDISKAVDIVKTNLTHALLLAVKYQEKNLNEKITTQTDSTIHGLFRIIAYCGLIGNALSALVFTLDNFKGEKKKKILQELAEYRAALDSEKAKESLETEG